MDYTKAIIAEVHQALQRLGSPERPTKPGGMSEALERAGAHRYLLSIVGSWGDTLEDAEVFYALKDWNAGTFEVTVYASTGGPPPPAAPRVRLRSVK